MRLGKRPDDRPPAPTVYVGDHTDKLRRIPRLPHDDDERPRREDRGYGATVFTSPWWADALPRFLRGRRRRR